MQQCNWNNLRNFRLLADAFTSVRVDKIGETIPRVLQRVKRYSQCVSATCWLGVITSECESKLKGHEENMKDQLNELNRSKEYIC